MRPTALESIRAVQAALAEVITPELTSAYAQDAAQTLQMLLESLASESDTAADQLSRDNATLEQLLHASRDAMVSALNGNEKFASIVSQIEKALSGGGSGAIPLTALTSRNNALRGVLEQILMAFEDSSGESELADLGPVRWKIYAHLREHATRGWSFWDVSSFRGRMAAIQSNSGRDDDPPTRAVE